MSLVGDTLSVRVQSSGVVVLILRISTRESYRCIFYSCFLFYYLDRKPWIH